VTSRNNRRVTYANPNTAVLRIGPLQVKWSNASMQMILMMILLSVGFYVVLFVWYANTNIAHVYPDGNGNWWSGFLHGYFAVPSFVVSWFDHDITIYQSANNGFWYNLWFLIGIGSFASMVRSSN
jgi:hypothetical protein